MARVVINSLSRVAIGEIHDKVKYYSTIQYATTLPQAAILGRALVPDQTFILTDAFDATDPHISLKFPTNSRE